MNSEDQILEKIDEKICYHCKNDITDEILRKDDKVFCCNGCLFVFELLNENKLDNFYNIENSKGITPASLNKNEFEFLEDLEVQEKLIQFKMNGKNTLTLHLPDIHCSACIYLLENLPKLDKGVLESRVNFVKKEAKITFDESQTSLRRIVEVLASIGYKPKLSLSNLDNDKNVDYLKPIYRKLGIAFFCFGNLMLLSLPDYFSGGDYEIKLKVFIGWLTFLFLFPLIYTATDYFRSAWAGLKIKTINLDVPIALGITSLVVRSAVELISQTGTGYVDTLAGLMFFLNLGKLFQHKTYDSLRFDRDYKSYFPLSVIRKNGLEEQFIPIKDIKVGDRIVIRNNEIVPADSILVSDKAMIDYSFVSGEATPVTIKSGEKIYSGGKQIGPSIEIAISKELHQSYLTDLWNNQSFDKFSKSTISELSNTVSKYFTYIIFIISFAVLAYWLPKNTNTALNALSAVLIVACPCALAMSMPFTYGTAMRVLGRNKLYLKNDKLIEKMSLIDTVLLDKTGTLTSIVEGEIEFKDHNDFKTNVELNSDQQKLIKSTVANSTHPLSQLIYNHLAKVKTSLPQFYEEIAGNGSFARIDNNEVKIGSEKYVLNASNNNNLNDNIAKNIVPESRVFISINNQVIGCFVVKNKYRNGIENFFEKLKNNVKVYILSGDNDSERENLEKLTGSNVDMYFKQLPEDKLQFSEKLKSESKHVMMVGDGLNDSGALASADVGIAITENTSNFTPGSDAILIAENLSLLSDFLRFSKKAVNTVYICYTISFLYNIVGLYFAVRGELSPVFAAILMPLSSITVVSFTVSRMNLIGKFMKLK